MTDTGRFLAPYYTGRPCSWRKTVDAWQWTYVIGDPDLPGQVFRRPPRRSRGCLRHHGHDGPHEIPDPNKPLDGGYVIRWEQE